MGRNNLAHRTGDAINAVLAAAGYNFRRLLEWLALLLSLILAALSGSADRKIQPGAVRARTSRTTFSRNTIGRR